MKVRFLLSTLTDFPHLKDPRGQILPEVVLAGRSNVGKSSLINHLLQGKHARTSATPGKTQLLNFFAIDEKWLIVDLPGYGFAKAPPEEIQKWSDAIDAYVSTRTSLKLMLLLLDSRRGWGEQDRLLAAWCQAKQIPLLLIFTKTDKLSSSEKEALLKTYPGAIFYSIKESKARQILQKRIEKILWD